MIALRSHLNGSVKPTQQFLTSFTHTHTRNTNRHTHTNIHSVVLFVDLKLNQAKIVFYIEMSQLI